jgi:hypothetical protein
MLNKSEIQELIIQRLQVVNGSCNSAYLDHNDGVFRGLLWVLTGKDPGTQITGDILLLLQAADIPCEYRDGLVHFG